MTIGRRGAVTPWTGFSSRPGKRHRSLNAALEASTAASRRAVSRKMSEIVMLSTAAGAGGGHAT